MSEDEKILHATNKQVVLQATWMKIFGVFLSISFSTIVLSYKLGVIATKIAGWQETIEKRITNVESRMNDAEKDGRDYLQFKHDYEMGKIRNTKFTSY